MSFAYSSFNFRLIQVRSTRDPDGVLFALTRDCGVLMQKDPLMWNWTVLSNLFLVFKISTF